MKELENDGQIAKAPQRGSGFLLTGEPPELLGALGRGAGNRAAESRKGA